MRGHRALTAVTAGALLIASLTACSSDPADSDGSDPDSSPTPAQDQGPTPPADRDPGDLSAVGDEDDELTCGEPPVEVLDWGADPEEDRPVIAAAVVYAATTATGDWYVVAIDRIPETTDGATADGEGTRSLALTNIVNPPPGEPQMIDLGRGAIGEMVPASWSSITWSGETLEAGNRAAARAQECLEEMATP